MFYNKLGSTGLDVSRFGMGCMRFPQKEKDGKKITDEAESIRMIRHAVDNGVDYFDTAYVYGDSEVVLGKALQDGYREKVNIATKIPPSRFHEFETCLDEELERLQTDYIDFYLLHFLCGPNWEKAKKHDLLNAMKRARDKGKIKYIGFSFHDHVDVFKEIIDAFPWDMCQIQLNYLDEDLQAGVEGLKYAADKGIGVVIMEPLKGGVLAEDIPAEILSKWNEFSEQRSPADWAFRWLCSFPEVGVVLSGVSSMEQLEENISIFKNPETGSMSDAEFAIVDEVKQLYNKKIKVPCTGCGYCVPCPFNVDIPQIFRIYNNVFMTGSMEYFNNLYQGLMINNGKDASKCTECGKCEEKCPQQIPIIQHLKDVDALYKT